MQRTLGVFHLPMHRRTHVGSRHMLARLPEACARDASQSATDAQGLHDLAMQGARHLLAYGGSRALLQAAYSVQQFDAETIGLKYSQGDRRHLLDAPAPAYHAGAYETVVLPGDMWLFTPLAVA